MADGVTSQQKEGGYTMPGMEVYEGEVDVVFTSFLTNREALDRVKTFPLEDGDTLVITYPKAGTTWMQEIAYLAANGADLAQARATPQTERCRYIDVCSELEGDQLALALQEPPPRMLKSHLPAQFFTNNLEAGRGKFIIVMRNPLDNLVSLFHFMRNIPPMEFNEDWNAFFEMFKKRRLLMGDLLDWNLSWWKRRDHPNVLIVTYEQMKADSPAVIRQVARHIGKNLTEEGVAAIAEHTSFDRMLTNPSVNYSLREDVPVKIPSFLRKGQVGDWKNYFSEEQKRYVDDRCKELCEPVGLRFELQ